MSKLGSKNSATFVADLTNGFVDTAQTGIVLVTFSDADTTPTVAGSNSFLASNTAPTSITNFDNGLEGQAIRILFTTANTTIVHDATKIKMAGAVNATPAANTALVFTRDAGGVWWQISAGITTSLFVTPAITLGDTAAAGAASTVIRSDSTIVAFDDGADPEPVGTVNSPGTDDFAARRDHVHAGENTFIVFLDDCIRRMNAGSSIPTTFTFDQLQWNFFRSAPGTMKDARTLADATFPDTGIWIFNTETSGGSAEIISGNFGSATEQQNWGGMRAGTIFELGTAVPAVAARNVSGWGMWDNSSGNDFEANNAARILFYKQPGRDADTGTAFTFHNFGDKQDFVALQVTVSGARHLYYIGSATDFITASSDIVKTTITFSGDVDDYTVIADIEGLGSSGSVTNVQARGSIIVGTYIEGPGTFTQEKLYLDYVKIKRPIP